MTPWPWRSTWTAPPSRGRSGRFGRYWLGAGSPRRLVADRHRPAGRRDDAARMADQPQAGGLAQPSHQLPLEQRQHLARSLGRSQPLSQLGDGGPAPNVLQRHRPDRKSTRLNSSHLVISYADSNSVILTLSLHDALPIAPPRWSPR